MHGDGSSPTVSNYHWNTIGCYTHPDHNRGNPTSFPTGQTSKNVTGDALTAGIITCAVTVDGVYFTSRPITLRISGMYVCMCVL